MKLQPALLEEIIHKTNNGKIVLDTEGRVILWNAWIAEKSGVPGDKALGRTLLDIFTEPLPNRLMIAVSNAIHMGMNSVLSHAFTPHPLPLPHPFFERGLMFQKITVLALGDDANEHSCLIDVVDVSHSVSREKKLQEQSKALNHLAKHDPLTGLPNRSLFLEYFDKTFERSRRKHTSFAVMYLDLDKFKDINDKFGHHFGDLVLIEVSNRLTKLLRSSDVVSRLGGDEFTILVDVTKQEEAGKVAEKVLEAMAPPMMLEGRSLVVKVSVGIATFPDCGKNPESLMKNADAALYRAKQEGRGNFRFFTSSMNTTATERITLEKELRKAVEHEQFEIFYQPQIDLKTNEIVGAEALLRWNHPERGVLAPGHFLSLAADTGLIIPIGEWVLERACAQVHEWSKDGTPPFRVAVNISGHHFRHSGTIKSLADLLDKTGMDPKFIELELTEEVLIERVEENIEALARLRELGVHIAIDDFGTGYSSLSYLKHFPINTLKIDRCFVQQLLTNPKDAIITKSVISLAHDLGLRVVAEGVETEDQLPFLLEQNCDEVQGYFYSRPIPAKEFWSYFVKRKP